MTIQREPHPVFVVLWSVWLVFIWVGIAMWEHPHIGLLALVSHFPIEIPAAAFRFGNNARDTLSEIATWVQRRTSHHKLFMRGWNAALFVGLIAPVSFLLGRVVAHYAGGGVDAIGFGCLCGGGCARFLWDHFSDPVTHG